MPNLTATASVTASAPVCTAAGHAVSLLVTGADDGMLKVLSTLRQRRYVVRELHVDLSGALGRAELRVEPDGRDPELLVEQLRRVVDVVRAERG